MSTFSVILPAAGRSRRFRDPAYKKPFAPLAGRGVWLHAAEKFLNRKDVKQVVVIVADEDREEFSRKFGANLAFMGVEVCRGGVERSDSIKNALEMVKQEVDFVAIHDAARPCIGEKQIEAVFAAAMVHGAAILAVPVSATLKRAGADGTIAETVDRRGLWEAQTPQVFRRDWATRAYATHFDATGGNATGGNVAATDDAALVELLGHKVHLVEGSPLNIKITSRDDLKLAEQILKSQPPTKPLGGLHPFADDDLWR